MVVQVVASMSQLRRPDSIKNGNSASVFGFILENNLMPRDVMQDLALITNEEFIFLC